MPSESSTDLVERELAELHRPRVEPPAPDERLEAELLSSWAARYARPHAGVESPRSREGVRAGVWVGVWSALAGHRLALACFALFVVLAGACVLPTSLDVPLGLAVEIRSSSGALPAQDIARYVQSRAEAGKVDVIVRELVRDGEPESHMQIRLWDQSLALGELEHELRVEFPALADAEIDERALEGEVETIWGRRLAHRAFDLSLRETDVEQARLELLVRLQQQGFDEDEITVKVRDRDDGHREVEVRVEQHRTGTDEGAAIDALGPEFRWVHDPRGAEAIEVPTGHADGPVRIELRPASGE